MTDSSPKKIVSQTRDVIPIYYCDKLVGHRVGPTYTTYDDGSYAYTGGWQVHWINKENKDEL